MNNDSIIKELELLYSVFLVSGYNTANIDDEDFELLKPIFNKYGWSLSESTNPMKTIVDHIYITDDIDLLKKLLNVKEDYDLRQGFGTGYDIEFASVEFITNDENDYLPQDLKDAYGETGDMIYCLCTKNYEHYFSQSRPFSNGIFYDQSKRKPGNV